MASFAHLFKRAETLQDLIFVVRQSDSYGRFLVFFLLHQFSPFLRISATTLTADWIHSGLRVPRVDHPLYTPRQIALHKERGAGKIKFWRAAQRCPGTV